MEVEKPVKSNEELLLERIYDFGNKEIEVQVLKDTSEINPNNFEETLLELIKKGIIFEVKPGFVQILEEPKLLPPKKREMTPEEKSKFYTEQINRAKYVLKQIEREGIEALYEMDKEKGIEYVTNKLNEEVKYFSDKLESLFKDNPELKEVKQK
jgi:hypothetical protein